jgi:glycosyltransferase involved in cell wall biosynthesis
VLEAMASGLPVITTAMDGSCDRITQGENGFILQDPTDYRGLAAYLDFLSDAATRRRIGDAARVTAASSARQEDNFRTVEAILAEVWEAM